MGIVREQANFRVSETDSMVEKKLSMRKRNRGTKKKKSIKRKGTLNTRETIEACSQVARTRFSCLIVNTAAAVTLAGRH